VENLNEVNEMPLKDQKTKISNLEKNVSKLVSVPLYSFLELCGEVSLSVTTPWESKQFLFEFLSSTGEVLLNEC